MKTNGGLNNKWLFGGAGEKFLLGARDYDAIELGSQ